MVGLFLTLPEELAPQEDQGMILGIGTAPEGATIDFTDRYAEQMGQMFAQLPEKEMAFAFSGFNGVTNAVAFVGLKDWHERKQTAQQIAQALFPRFMGITGIMAFPAG